jgi:hypothetical protein
MRHIIAIACASAVLAAGVQAQEAVQHCRYIKDDGERLKCYDSSSSAREKQGERTDLADEAWEIRDEKSPLDDSPLLSASLRSSDGRAYLLMRCKDRKTEVAINKWGFVKCGADVRVIYRVNQEQAVETPWNSHPSCVLVIAPSPVQFIRALTDQGKVYFRMFDHHGAPHDALFNLGRVSEVRSRLARACSWDGAPEPAVNPAPNAAIPAVPPSRNDLPK